MAYNEESLRQLSDKYSELSRTRDRLMFRLIELNSALLNERAKEYCMQGVGRRLGTLTRCIENIYKLFPINRTELLPREDLLDLGINLHAFMVNVSGLFDNLAWVYVLEYDLVGNPKECKLHRNSVSLFNRDLQRQMPANFSSYLCSDHLREWYSEHSKNYRDAVAHRIPLYVPPSLLTGEAQRRYLELEAQIQDLDISKPENLELYGKILDEQTMLGEANPLCVHSTSELARPMYLHAQVLADYAMVEEVVLTYCDEFKTRKP